MKMIRGVQNFITKIRHCFIHTTVKILFLGLEHEEVIQSHIAYLKNVPIDETDPPSLPESPQRVHSAAVAAEGQDNAHLVGGSPCFFASSVSAENRQAVMDSMLFAQLAANKQVPQGQDNNTIEWYNAFRNILVYLGWTSKSFEFSEVEAHGPTFSINSAFLKMLSDFVIAAGLKDGSKILDGIKNMISTLESDQTGHYFTIYSHFHQNARQNAFDIGVVTQDPNADPEVSVPILVLFAFDMNVNASKLQVLWATYESSSTHVKSAQNQVILNKKMFQKVQDTVETRLGDRMKDCITGIAI